MPRPAQPPGADRHRQQQDAIAPGYRDFVPAVAAGRFISMSRFHVYPTTFAAMDHVLDEIAALE